jgi:drug/metabolite transporter (DMT)-like permease
LAIVFSVLCAVVYGSSDFCGGLASRRTPTLGVVVVSQAVGFVVLLALMPLFGGAPQRGDLIWGAVCGVAGGGAIALLYRGLAIGTMGVVSPITAVLAAAVPIAYGVAVHGERPVPLAIAGIVAALIAVVCVSLSPADAPVDGTTPRIASGVPPGLFEALGAGLFFGVFFIALAQTHASAGMYPLLVARLTSFALLAVGGIVIGRAADLRVARPSIALVAACGAGDMTANVLYVLAAHSGMLSIVAVLSSLYPASTVALAAIVLRERLVRVQWVGVAMAFAGVLAISLAR